MDAPTIWLCPTPLHRERMLEMEGKLARPRALMYGSLALSFGVATRAAQPGAPGPAAPARHPAGALLGPRRYGGLVLTLVILLASTVAVDPAGFAHDPTFTLTGLAIFVGLTAFAHLLMRVEMESRSDVVLDPLTGLLNRKALATRFEEIAQQASLAGGTVCLLACDLDHFKQINDRYGHERGDHVLHETAYVLRKHLRSFELVYRFGGEEFLIVLPDATVDRGARSPSACAPPSRRRGRAG